MTPVEKYRQLLNEQNKKVDFPKIVSYNPKPNVVDYERGFITRYFIYDKSWKKFTEITKNRYNGILIDSSIYETRFKLFTMKWRISGEMYTVISEGVLNIGVIDANRNVVLTLNEQFPGFVQKFRRNYAQFYK